MTSVMESCRVGPFVTSRPTISSMPTVVGRARRGSLYPLVFWKCSLARRYRVRKAPPERGARCRWRRILRRSGVLRGFAAVLAARRCPPARSKRKMSCNCGVSPSMPTISATLSTRRTPSSSRRTETTKCSAETICSRMARDGNSSPAIKTIVSKRAEGVARAVGVDCGHAAVVPGVHGLQHVQRLAAAYFAHDDPVGPHAEGVDDQVAGGNQAAAFDVRRPRFHPHDVFLVHDQFGRIFDGHDPLAVGDGLGQRAEEG